MPAFSSCVFPGIWALTTTVLVLSLLVILTPLGLHFRNFPSPGYEPSLLEEGEEVMGFGGRPRDKPQMPYFLVGVAPLPGRGVATPPTALGSFAVSGKPASNRAVLLPPKACTCDPPLEATVGGCEPFVHKCRNLDTPGDVHLPPHP